MSELDREGASLKAISLSLSWRVLCPDADKTACTYSRPEHDVNRLHFQPFCDGVTSYRRASSLFVQSYLFVQGGAEDIVERVLAMLWLSTRRLVTW